MAPLKTEPAVALLRFGRFELDLDVNELRKNGYRIRLQEQQLNLLKVLLERPGDLISRETLRERLWQPNTFVDFDHSLNTAMMRLREALGDPSDNPIFIQTEPRKGYRFIAPVRHIAKEQPAVDAAPPPVPPALPSSAPHGELAVAPASQPTAVLPAVPLHQPPAPQPFRLALSHTSLYRVALALLLLLAVLSYILLRPKHDQTALSANHPVSLVVLPLDNLSGDRNQDYFADGMTDELIASLARISSIRVISRTTAMEYKGTHKSLEKIAQDLGVDAVVEGTVLRSGDRVRITAELVQVSTDRHLWADTYEAPLGDILTLQNQVASAIVSQIQIKLTPQDKERLATSRPVNSEAYEDYLKGRYYWGKRSEEGLEKAIQYFQSATEKDPQYALAYAGLADCYGILGAAIVGTVPTSQVAPKAEKAAIRAVELDASLAETQTALATVQFNYDWNWKAAETGFRRAIELNPNYATAHQRYSLYLIAMGRSAESIAEMNRARALDPLSLSMNFSLGWRLYMAGQYDQAIAQLNNAIEMDPSFVLAHIVLGQTFEQKGLYPQAIAELQKAAAMSHDIPPVVAALGHVYAVSGKRAEALNLLRDLKLRSQNQYVSPFYLAVLYAGLGDHHETLNWLNQAYDDRSNNMIFLSVDPQFQGLHSDPEFQSLLHRLGLPAPAK